MNSVKNIVKQALAWLARNRFFWRLFGKPISSLGYYLDVQYSLPQRREKNAKEQQQRFELLISLSPDQTVLNGPFKGMRYPTFVASGSTIGPKIIGSYEAELHEVIEHVLQQPYAAVLDVGCAEGYYAVGFARQLDNIPVHGFDINPDALELCSKLASENKVADQITLHSRCDERSLFEALPAERSLVMCDCEGYELELLSESVAARLSQHDLLVELHDFIDLSISAKIKQRFESTHKIQSVFSVDDLRKAHTYIYPQTDHLPLTTKVDLFAEKRPTQMEWLYLQAK